MKVAAALERGVALLDMRAPRTFADCHVRGAVNLQFNRADLAERAEMVLMKRLEYIVHAEPQPVAVVAVGILRRAGFKVLGHLAGGINAWESGGLPVERLDVIDVDELRARLDKYQVIDAREGYEYRHGHVAGARHLPSGEAWTRAASVNLTQPLAVMCGNQVRSSLVASILQRTGSQPVLVVGGMVDWLERGYPIERGSSAALATE